MSGEIEFGKCQYCGKECNINRKYYRYPVKCECHSPQHFEIVFHCNDCQPIEPKTTKVILKTSDLSRLQPVTAKTEQEDEAPKHPTSWRDFTMTEQEKPSESAEEFLQKKYHVEFISADIKASKKILIECMEEYAAIVERRSCQKCAMSWTKGQKQEIPSDEEIGKQADFFIEHIYAGYASRALRSAMVDMGKWMKEGIKK